MRARLRAPGLRHRQRDDLALGRGIGMFDRAEIKDKLSDLRRRIEEMGAYL